MARMVQINGNWEIVRNIQDIIGIIKMYYNDDLANELEDLMPEHTDSDYYALESELRDLEDKLEFYE